MQTWLPVIYDSNVTSLPFRQPAQRWDDRETAYYPNYHSTDHRGESIMAGRVASMPGNSSTRGRRDSSQTRSNHQGAKMEPQFMTQGVLWVDAVGGFLVSLKDEVTLGQAVPNAKADIAIQADVSRRHARIRRVGEDYLIEPYALVTVGNQPIVKSTTLIDGDEICLGTSVRIRFEKPHPLSNSARLKLLTGQRLQPAVDGVVLMGESCLLGPASNNHISCSHWDTSMVLSRGEEGKLRFRAGERVEVDGAVVGDKGQVDWGSRLSGKNFAITLERL
jgi:hypothetical protein